jgi:2-keto-4-pentenoate hydratase/2-oxohepta-3-ene-1,7-dioic acid hydratase in catechol pathway
MRWVTYESASGGSGNERTGLVIDETIHGLEQGTRLIDLLGDDGSRLAEAGDAARKSPAEVLRLDDVRLLPPIPRPPTVRDFVSFEAHHRTGIEAVGQKWDDAYYDLPMFYFTNANALFGDGDEIRIPGNTRQMDFELELCAIVGRGGRDLDPAQAEQHIAGYCIFNDWSARDIQRDEMARCPIGPAKGKDSAITMGPMLVTPDEIEDVRKGHGFDLEMTASVNGKVLSRGNWSSVYWSFGEMLAYASRNSDLVPGDVLASGTVGTGCILELTATKSLGAGEWLKEGDEVVLEIERLGRLRNRIAVAPPPIPIRGVVNGRRV